MKTSSLVPPTLRFGLFELDSRAGELRKKGMKIRLQGQPLDILVMLLERRGETITREELQQKLWAADTFVDFEQGLNNAMKRLRAALDDDSENPRFIETLPRRGYRFIGPVNGAELSHQAKSEPTRRLRPVPLAILGGLALAVVAALLPLNVGGWRERFFGAPKPQIQALAVLPLTNLSGDPGQEYFADGMTESLITELGKISNPRVISRQSVMQYKSSKKSLQEIAQELKVDAVLEGAVEHSGDRVRVSVHLSQASPERQLWAQEYDRSISDALVLQNEIARAVTDEIQVKLTQEERTRLTSAHPVNPEAQEDYLHGRYFLSRGTEQDLRTAVAYFDKAIEKDRGYALAYVWLSSAYFELGGSQTAGHSPIETLPKAQAAVLRALELDPSLGEAHVALSWIRLVGWKWSEAEKEAGLAVSLGPNNTDAHHAYSEYLSTVGRHEKAIREMKYAIELDPLNSDTQSAFGWVAYRARQYDLAIHQFQRIGNDFGLSLAYVQKKMYAEGIEVLQKGISQFGRDPMRLAALALVYGSAGRKHESQKLIHELNEISRHRFVSPFLFVNAYIGLGDKDKALMWLERAYQEHEKWFYKMKVVPLLDPLRSEPRFQALLRRMNFPS